MKGLALYDQGNIREALEVFTKLTQDYPALPEPYNNLAVIYASQGQYEKAREALERSVRANPSYAAAHENLGDVYAKLAGQAYDKALLLESSNSAARRKLSIARQVLGGQTTLAAVKQTQPAGMDGSTDALGTAQAWALAWARKDADAYLGHYAADFKTPDGEPREAWNRMRRERIAASRVIAVEIESPKVTLTGSDQARVSFRQNYRSAHLNTLTRKTLVMTRVDGRWQIREEIVGK